MKLNTQNQSNYYNILLADDDEDDCLFFKEALTDLFIPASVNMVSNGVELMRYLESNLNNLPNVLFMDLNMPRKTGYECLSEIKKHEKLMHLPVIIFSTSYNAEMADLLYEVGANYYVRKPADFKNYKAVKIGRAHV